MKIESRVNSLEKEVNKERDLEETIFAVYTDSPPPRKPDGSYDYEKITDGRPCSLLYIPNYYGE